MPRSIAGKRALVTGASSGFGADFARELARRGVNIIIVARRTQRLEALAAEIRKANQVEVHIITADLSLPTAAQDLYDRVAALGLQVDILVNNAGYGLFGEHAGIAWSKEQAMLQVDIVTLAGLTKLFLPAMLERHNGYILNVSSNAAFQPTPGYASYAAAKTFVLYQSEALFEELRGTGVSVTVIAAPVAKTEFLQVSGQAATTYQRWVMMRSEDVVRIAVNAMLARKRSVVPGLVNQVLAFGAAISPRALSARVAQLMMQSGDLSSGRH